MPFDVTRPQAFEEIASRFGEIDILVYTSGTFLRVDAARRRRRPRAGLDFAIAKEVLGQVGDTVSIANRPYGGLRQTRDAAHRCGRQ